MNYILYPWEQRKFNMIFKILPNNTLSRAELSSDGDMLNIHYGDILTNYDEVIDISKVKTGKFNSAILGSKVNHAILKNNDLVIADTAEDEMVGKTSEIEGIYQQKVMAGLHTIPIRPMIEFYPGFLGFELNSNFYHNQLRPLMQGIKVTSISKTALTSTIIAFPKSLKEQKEIANILSRINVNITLHQRAS